MLDAINGKWRTDPKDKKTFENYGNVSLEFSEDGKLTYTIHEEDKDQKMFLTLKNILQLSSLSSKITKF